MPQKHANTQTHIHTHENTTQTKAKLKAEAEEAAVHRKLRAERAKALKDLKAKLQVGENGGCAFVWQGAQVEAVYVVVEVVWGGWVKGVVPLS